MKKSLYNSNIFRIFVSNKQESFSACKEKREKLQILKINLK